MERLLNDLQLHHRMNLPLGVSRKITSPSQSASTEWTLTVNSRRGVCTLTIWEAIEAVPIAQ